MGDDLLDWPPIWPPWIVKRRESCSGANQIAALTKTFVGAEDGIGTRDPHLGKEVFSVSAVGPTPLSCCFVHPGSTSSTQFVAVVERSTIATARTGVVTSGLTRSGAPVDYAAVRSADYEALRTRSRPPSRMLECRGNASARSTTGAHHE
jgi:hypothetical protein